LSQLLVTMLSLMRIFSFGYMLQDEATKERRSWKYGKVWVFSPRATQ